MPVTVSVSLATNTRLGTQVGQRSYLFTGETDESRRPTTLGPNKCTTPRRGQLCLVVVVYVRAIMQKCVMRMRMSGERADGTPARSLQHSSSREQAERRHP